mgnify:CR=1 FL=1
MAWQIFWQNILPLAMAGAAVAIATVAFRLVDYPIRHQLQKAHAGRGALQSDRATAGPSQAEPAITRDRPSSCCRSFCGRYG